MYMHLLKKVDVRGNPLNLTISDLISKVKMINWKKVITLHEYFSIFSSFILSCILHNFCEEMTEHCNFTPCNFTHAY